MDQNYKVCVCDFGLTQAKPKDVSNLEYDPHGSPLYMAPEVFFGDYNEKCDIYSFGIGLWEMITQKEAFEEINGNLAQFVEAVCYNDYRPPIPDGVPSSLVKLMNRCWAKDARSRPSMSEIVQELDLVAIDSAIQDEHGRKLWKSLFRDKVLFINSFKGKRLITDLITYRKKLIGMNLKKEFATICQFLILNKMIKDLNALKLF